MRRREFIALFGGVAATWPLAARAQKAPVRIGYLNAGAATSRNSADTLAIINEGLRDNGLIDGRDYVFEARFVAGRYERFPEMARELAQAGVVIIIANTIAAVRAAQALTPPLPIVMVPINDPVGSGLIASLARLHAAQSAAQTLGVTVTPAPSTSEAELESAVAAAAATPGGAIIAMFDTFLAERRDFLVSLVIRYRLPAIYGSQIFAPSGGLMAYASDYPDIFRRAADYVDRILRGTRPGDLPVQEPAKFTLSVNLKAATAIGLVLPQALITRADEVIE